MLRFIVKQMDFRPCAGAGEPEIVEFKTLDVDVPKLEELLLGNPQELIRVELVGVEKLQIVRKQA